METQTTDLVRAISGTLQLTESYSAMLERVESRLPATREDSEIFNKSASQLKTVTLDITDHTPISTAKHILASITRTRQALEEASVGVQRKKVDIADKMDQLSRAESFEADRLHLDIQELQMQVQNTEAYARGAIRKVSFLIRQYDAILETIGVESISEDDYEEDQQVAHVKTAFFQALTAARSRNGIIDEGNMIYMFHLGINGRMAQAEVIDFLKSEDAMIAAGRAPTHQMVVDWLTNCGIKYGRAPREYAEMRGLVPKDEISLVDPNALQKD